MEYIRKIAILVLISIFALTSFGCGQKKVEEPAKEKQMPVEVAEVRKGVFRKAIVLSGTTEPKSSITLIPKVAGAEKIVNISVEVGTRVSVGQTIAVLDQSTISIQLNSARTTYEDALRNYERNKVLFEAGAVPQSAMEQLEVALSQAKNALDAQELAYNNTIITTPISGVVTSVPAQAGNLASAQTPIAEIADIDTLEIKCSINETQVNKLVEGDEVQILIPAAGTKIFTGKIKSISPTMDNRTKAYPLTVVLENKENIIKAGMYAEVEIVTDVQPDVMIVPAQAVIQRDNISKVFIVIDDKAFEKEVEAGITDGKETVIIRGINPGDQVITKGNEDVVRGDPVKVVGRGEK
ncbi:MAG: efflux RND transporter periplasmic adaptor subunit [Bacillota bacterium]